MIFNRGKLRPMRFWRGPLSACGLLAIVLSAPGAAGLGQESALNANELVLAESTDSLDQPRDNSGASSAATPAAVAPIEQPGPLQQPKRILGIMPNFRAVSAGTIPPPPTIGQSFKIATQNSFDYSSIL